DRVERRRQLRAWAGVGWKVITERGADVRRDAAGIAQRRNQLHVRPGFAEPSTDAVLRRQNRRGAKVFAAGASQRFAERATANCGGLPSSLRARIERACA